MARSQFIIEGGLKITAADSDVGASILNGSGAPSGDADLGSIYQDITNGAQYIKKIAGAGAGNWELMADAAYVADAIAAIPGVDLSPYLKHDGTVAMTGDLQFNGNDATGLATITDGTNPVIDLVQGAIWHYNSGTSTNMKVIDWHAKQLLGLVNSLPGDIAKLDWSGDNVIVNQNAPIAGSDIATADYVNDQIGAIDLTPFLKKDGSVDIAGVLQPDGDITRNLGAQAARFATIYASEVRGTGAVGNAYAFDLINGGIISDADFGVSGLPSIDLQNHKIIDPAGETALDWSNRWLQDVSSVKSIDWESRSAYNNAGVSTLNWGSYQTVDIASTVSIDWNDRKLFHQTGPAMV